MMVEHLSNTMKPEWGCLLLKRAGLSTPFILDFTTTSSCIWILNLVQTDWAKVSRWRPNYHPQWDGRRRLLRGTVGVVRPTRSGAFKLFARTAMCSYWGKHGRNQLRYQWWRWCLRLKIQNSLWIKIAPHQGCQWESVDATLRWCWSWSWFQAT